MGRWAAARMRACPGMAPPGVLEQWIGVVYDGRELDEGYQVEVGQSLASEAAVV